VHWQRAVFRRSLWARQAFAYLFPDKGSPSVMCVLSSQSHVMGGRERTGMNDFRLKYRTTDTLNKSTWAIYADPFNQGTIWHALGT
jgi:hypothetical protein